MIRHAESVAKEQGIVQGQGLDVPLSERGKQQLQKLGGAVASLSVDKVYSSTALRAQNTAQVIRSVFPDVSHEETELLNERSKGNAEGLTKTEFKKKYPHIEDAWSREEDPRVPGGENFADVEARVMPLVAEHLKKHAGETVLYVGHGNVFRVIIGAALGIPVEKRNRIQIDTCSMNVLEYEQTTGRWHLVALNQLLVDL